ncbi:PD40 domain-containing protein [Vulgatibacter incomptus]|uniref:TolB protein n=1 Tax=Vulgatibacter incomptus TaxID=1391653 RepID=A0A0K1PAB9_9BACT|nr:PD40 domain-containing protein [Vulgatibacter incomptus]AKU90483.1 tolB protein precursor [Vulgatibacter incomptus]
MIPRLPAWFLALLGAALLAAALPAWAYAPEHRWRTLESPHFVLHFHEGLYPIALRAARSLESAHDRLVPLLDAEPNRKTQVVLGDDSDEANGSANAYERPRINLLAEPPDDLSVLGDYDDYVFLLVAHEYVHVLHIGTVSGLPAWLNWIFGDLWTPNGLHPRFLTEGLATYHESQLSSAGRIRSAIFDMYLRADVLEDRLLPLSRITNGPLVWPRGTAWYLYGGRMLEWIAETRGDEAIQRYIHAYGRNAIPFSMNLDLKSAAGVDFNELWDEWAEAMRKRYAAQAERVRARGPITEPALRTAFGERTGAPRWDRSGTALYYVEASGDRRSRLRALDPRTGGDREVQALGTSGTLSSLPGGGVILARSEFFDSERVFGELFLVDDRSERQLSSGLRASEPDVSPDGAWIYFVQRGGGRTVLARVPFREPDAAPEIVYRPPEGRVIYGPRVSPDGGRIVFSQTRRGPGRDLLIVPAHGDVEKRPLTDDDAIDLDPSWAPDGRSVIFASDRNGIFDVYSVPSTGGPLTRLTNVLTGAFQPELSPDGRWLAWTTYSSSGFDVAVTPVASLVPTPAEPFVSDRSPPKAEVAEPLYSVTRYDPLQSLGPQTWFPYFGTDISGTVLGASIAGSDVVGLHAWTLSAGYGISSRQPEGAFTYGYNGFHPYPAISGATTFRNVPGFPRGTTERVTVADFGLTLPWASMWRSSSVRLGYEATWFTPVDARPGREPAPGVATELQLGFQHGSGDRPAESVSLEDGIGTSLTGRLGSKALGGDFDYAAVDASATAWIRVPWTKHHVLAATARAGVSTGDLGERRIYGLGGPVLRDPLVDLLYTKRILGGGVLRGYAPGAFVGKALLLGSLEYRFPIAWIDRSPDTLPLYAGKLAGAVFAEAGNAFDGLPIPRMHPSVGAELRMGVDLGWGFAGSLRLGDAWGFDGELGGNRVYLGVGASF